MNYFKIKFSTNHIEYYNDFMDVVRAFYPYIIDCDEGTPFELLLNEKNQNEYNVIINDFKNADINSKLTFKLEENASELNKKSLIKRYSKILIYDHLNKITGRDLPYGSLTGIRPTKLFHQLEDEGIDAKNYFINELKVTEQKASLIENICNYQKPYYKLNMDEVDIFVNIPICVSRCSYCSFLSAELSKIKKSVEPYVDLLVMDIIRARELIEKLGLTVRTIYVGGGTPTSLNHMQLRRVLSELAKFDTNEFTVEAGRPDTITLEKLQVMSDCKVNRISINPQTFNQRTLDIIGRKHTVADIFKKYEMARQFDFEINMDLIAMLPEETFNDFKFSVDSALNLEPENITIHTLALKRGSQLKDSNYDIAQAAMLAEEMVNYSQLVILDKGYVPYYMYKQKYVSGNLENVGYCKPGTECVYNIDIMEEIHTILACGAGGISKVLFNEGKSLERLPNPKGLDVYLNRQDENFEKRDKLFIEKLK